MSTSGVKVNQATIDVYNDMKLHKKIRYVPLTIDMANGIIPGKPVAKRSDQEAEYQEFLESLPSDQACYYIVDLDITQKSGVTSPKMFLITWCPDVPSNETDAEKCRAQTKSNMLCTTSKRVLADQIRKGCIEIQANDKDDLDYQQILDKGSKGR